MMTSKKSEFDINYTSSIVRLLDVLTFILSHFIDNLGHFLLDIF